MNFSEMNNYESKYFTIYEFVPKKIIDRFGKEQSKRFINPLVRITADRIRARYSAPMTINTPTKQARGFRDCDSNVGAGMSQHRFGNAIDFNIKGVDCAKIRADIISDPDCWDFEFITELEDFKGMGWCHIACSGWGKKKNGLLIYGR